MLERFIELEESLSIFYERHGSGEEFPVTEGELETIKCIIPALKVVEESMKLISTEAATLYEAEKALLVSFIF